MLERMEEMAGLVSLGSAEEPVFGTDTSLSLPSLV